MLIPRSNMKLVYLVKRKRKVHLIKELPDSF